MTRRPTVDPRTGTFADGRLEQRFLRDSQPSRLRRARRGMALFTVLWLGWFVHDLMVVDGPTALGLLGIRVAALIPAWMFLHWVPPDDGQALQRSLTLIASVIALAAADIDLLYPSLDDHQMAAHFALIVANTAWSVHGTRGLLLSNLLIAAPGWWVWTLRAEADPSRLWLYGVAMVGAMFFSWVLHVLSGTLMRERQVAVWRSREQLASRERMLGGLASALRAPLDEAEAMLDTLDETSSGTTEVLHDVEHSLETLAARVTTLLRLGRLEGAGGAPGFTSVAGLLEDVADALRRGDRGAEVSVEASRALEVRAEEWLVRDALVGCARLLQQEGAGRLLLEGKRVEGGVRLSVAIEADAGARPVVPSVGVRPEDPGLELAMARRIVQAHRGALELAGDVRRVGRVDVTLWDRPSAWS